MSSKKKRLEALKERREELVKEYQRLVLVLSGMQDQIADIDGDIRMLENEQKKKST
tara:strand:+ start:772 stop:939 length:168 start_codon:yes stop_codon:yes gene_type:complete